MQSDGSNSALSPVVYVDIVLGMNTHYITYKAKKPKSLINIVELLRLHGTV